YGVRQFTGPLAPYGPGFSAELARLGFTKHSSQTQLGLVAHLSRWLDEQNLGTTELTEVTVDRFLVARRAAGYTAFRTVQSLRPLLGYLRELGVSPLPQAIAPVTPVDVLLARYHHYLLVERCLTAQAARGYLDLVRPFVAARAGIDAVELSTLTSVEVSAFLVAQSRRLAPKTTQRLASALRSLLRFWHVEGLISGPLDETVPKVANRRPGRVQPLEPAQVQAMLDSCDRTQAAGRRDLAILTLLARLGLRAGEVARLHLDDIDWRAGELTIRGKGNRRDRLPLPADVGEHIADYLQYGRPSTVLDRSVFTRIKAPHRGLTNGGVTQAVAAAAKRAGLGTIYAHRLRHSAATAMLVEGAPLAEIGQVLRHRRPLTTAIYTKVDIEALRALARPWPIPGGGS
ncbi:tyrosine-type recombinase/integrase, partial [Streptosporangium subroseum]|uniref:tyrosine-type recombinase/integrase n=1 Tax=Streptosporangium subroseum TaxID=106412 RepID=UPI003420EEA3